MNKKLISFQFFILFFFQLTPALSVAGSEHKNFAELSSSEIEGRDFEITSTFKNPDVLVMAIHGGRIEFGTSEIAHSIASTDWNYYSFSGLKKTEDDNWSLHLTSTHFDEPRALALAEQSNYCISVHAFKNAETPTVCVGGNSTELGRVIADHLKSTHLDFKVEYPCVRFPAKKAQNIVNRCLNQGVQLEISVDALDEIKKSAHHYESFVKSIRTGIHEFLQGIQPERP